MADYKVLVEPAEYIGEKINELANEGYRIYQAFNQSECRICVIMVREDSGYSPSSARELLNRAYKYGVYSSWVDKTGRSFLLHSLQQSFTMDGEGIVAAYEGGDERVHLLSDYGKTWAIYEEDLLDKRI